MFHHFSIAPSPLPFSHTYTPPCLCVLRCLSLLSSSCLVISTSSTPNQLASICWSQQDQAEWKMDHGSEPAGRRTADVGRALFISFNSFELTRNILHSDRHFHKIHNIRFSPAYDFLSEVKKKWRKCQHCHEPEIPPFCNNCWLSCHIIIVA